MSFLLHPTRVGLEFCKILLCELVSWSHLLMLELGASFFSTTTTLMLHFHLEKLIIELLI